MFPSSALCRAQEAYHRDRAAGEPLENVRIRAMTAAVAWGNEALVAERREARYRRTRLAAAAKADQPAGDTETATSMPRKSSSVPT